MKKLVKNILLSVRNLLDPLFSFREVSVLCYHEYDPHLAEHLQALRARGYTFVSLADVVEYAKDGSLPPACAGRHKAVSITFDDGYPDFVPQVLPILERFGAPVTLFATGAYDTSALHNRAGVEIGYHTKTHPNLAKLSGEELVKEIAPPSGERYFAYPGGNHSPQAAAAVRAAGYRAAFTIRPVPVRQGADLYYIPRAVITPDMSVRDVLFYSSCASQWYRTLKNIL